MKMRFCCAIVTLLLCVNAASIQGAELDLSEDFGKIDIHGFLSQGFMKTSKNNYLTEDSEDGSFQFNEMGINFAAELSDKLRAGLQLFSRDLGDLGNNEVILDWGYGDYRWQDWLGFRLGRVKMPFGFYNETRDFDMLRTSILLPQGVYDEGLRDSLSALNGISLYGEIPLETLGGLSYQTQYGYITGSEDGAIAMLVEDGTAFDVTDVEFLQAANAQLQWQTPLDGLRLGVTGAVTRGSTVDMETTSDFALGSDIPVQMRFGEIESVVLSGEYVMGDWTFNAEWFERTMDVTTTADNFPVDITGDGVPDVEMDNVQLSDEDMKQKGWYCGASYRFTEWFELGSYYSVSGDDDKTKDWALSGRFDLADNWTFKLEGHLFDGDSILMSDTNPGGTDDDWFMVMAKMTFSF